MRVNSVQFNYRTKIIRHLYWEKLNIHKTSIHNYFYFIKRQTPSKKVYTTKSLIQVYVFEKTWLSQKCKPKFFEKRHPKIVTIIEWSTKSFFRSKNYHLSSIFRKRLDKQKNISKCILSLLSHIGFNAPYPKNKESPLWQNY